MILGLIFCTENQILAVSIQDFIGLDHGFAVTESLFIEWEYIFAHSLRYFYICFTLKKEKELQNNTDSTPTKNIKQEFSILHINNSELHCKSKKKIEEVVQINDLKGNAIWKDSI